MAAHGPESVPAGSPLGIPSNSTEATGVTPTGGAAEGSSGERRLGEFRILRRLGQGGMAEVFLAEQTSLKRNVAIKVLKEDRLNDASHVKRFKTEAMAAAALSHPNIVQVFMIGEAGGTHYIAQEYVQGMNLREYLARKGPPEAAMVIRILRQVASALQAAHAAGIVHRDIKPENILLTRKGDAKVADFGLAQLTQGGERLNLTQVGVTMGTPLYMSPEQVNGRKLDQRSDLYSLGVTCYHLLTGNPPFRGETALSVAVQHLKQEADPLETIRGDLSPALCRIIHRMMSKDPEKRPQNAAELLKELKRIGASRDADEGQAAELEPVAETIPLAHERTSVWSRTAQRIWNMSAWPVGRQVAVVLILGLLVAGASAGVGWLAREPDPFLSSAPQPRQRAATIFKQYWDARSRLDDEAAWQQVIDYPATDQAELLVRDRARQHLAMLYLSKDRYDEAGQIFNEFAGYSESDAEWRAFGMAGQAVILHVRGEYRQSQELIDRVEPPFSRSDAQSQSLYSRLDEHMKELVNETRKRNVEHLQNSVSRNPGSLLNPAGNSSGQTTPEANGPAAPTE